MEVEKSEPTTITTKELIKNQRELIRIYSLRNKIMRNRLKELSKQLNNIIKDKDWMKHVEEYVFEEEE